MPVMSCNSKLLISIEVLLEMQDDMIRLDLLLVLPALVIITGSLLLFIKRDDEK